MDARPSQQQRLPSLRQPPIGFAHRGARAHAPENTIEAFELALRLGATGLETDAWSSADGAAVLHHDGEVGRFLRKTPIAEMSLAQLDGRFPTLEDLYTACGGDYELSIDLKDDTVAGPIIAAARDVGAEGRLWLCHPSVDLLSELRSQTTARLVNSTRIKNMKEGPERRAANLADRGIDAVNLPHGDWSGGLTTLFHRFDRYCLAWDAQYERVVIDLVRMGIDGIFSDHVDRLVEGIADGLG